MQAVTAALGGRLAFGGDYNPEQWPEAVWREDVALMREAGVNLVTVGVFSWALLEPERGRFEFGWLDRVLDLLHEGGIAVDLATATASPPAWFLRTHPEAALVDDRGTARSFGARQAYCPSSTAYRSAATALAAAMAQRYAMHPAVVLWHVNNEFGDHNWACFCDASAVAFRDWLRARYADLDALNAAWGTAFWSQRYGAWEEIGPPRAVSYNSFANPTQQLDWKRFCSDQLLANHRAEAAAVRAHAKQPLTTNFMSFFAHVDYRSWTGEVDVISNDHYLTAADPGRAQQLAMTADLERSLAGGAPWLVMEQSTSAVNWQPRNRAKAPGELLRNALAHVARGSDGALFFQWRASTAGAEKYHSALLPHAGTDTKVWRESVQLGADLRSLAEVAGSRVAAAPAAVLYDWPSSWAATLDSHPSVDVDPLAEARRWHAALWARNVGVDVPGPDDELSGYRLIVVPALYLLTDGAAARIAAAVRAGAHAIVTYWSGIVDEHDHVRAGGYPGALRDLLGVRIEEFFPLLAGEHVPVPGFGSGAVWSELGRTTGADMIAVYGDGSPVAGSPAITRNPVGDGEAWYVGTVLDDAAVGTVLERVLGEAAVAPVVAGLPAGAEAVRRRAEDGTGYLFVVNGTAQDVTVPGDGVELLSGAPVSGQLEVPAGAVAVLREAP